MKFIGIILLLLSWTFFSCDSGPQGELKIKGTEQFTLFMSGKPVPEKLN